MQNTSILQRTLSFIKEGNLLETFLAILPLGVSILMLVVLQRGGKQAGIATLISSIIPTLIFPFFHLSAEQLFIALGKGVSASLLVFYLLLPSLLLYHLLQATGGMRVLGWGIARLVPDRDIQVLLLVMGLAPFAESVTGFGVGTILIIPIFVALDFSLTQSAILGMLGQMAIPWGGLGIGTILGAQLTNLDPSILAAHTALLTAPLPSVYGLVALAVAGGKKSCQHQWSAAIAVGAILSVSLYVFSLSLGVELAGIIASVIAICILLACGYVEVRKNRQKGVLSTSSNRPKKTISFQSNVNSTDQKIGTVKLSLWQVLAPYIFLTALLLVSRLILPIKIWLQSHFVLSIPAINLNLALLYNPGFTIFVTVFAAVKILGVGRSQFRVGVMSAWRQFLPGGVAIACFLMASQVMQTSGMMTTIGTAAATLGHNYKWVAPWLAALGGWVTGSSTSSNALFSQLQLAISTRSGLPLDWLMSAQNGASAHATIIAPARMILAATTVGLYKGEALLLRLMAPLALAAVAITMLLLALATNY
ncbi:L-lactate permease [Aetokthonos hydrillicola Thurmond2011]|jgi:lactate permease|uniref:L-lactate permease n=1 Tax=Aetokthonos hydrillicola Thurmond2011 TaxID=2712845 RepID=A0AAP5MBR7_9CYAN|nr:L-lactate permease [Aetokthonos hydrillicola]MBO3461071.1 L-lactate permease [Aetokthonos hydrillicola CCALA 1050]MBW4586325.1 L-lactate permease [Aetokthonos hydrillicola CCALA 1050]MDR9897453.1 L-lactate permease [Aetokthonos hydrillicola Thurmond2011]